MTNETLSFESARGLLDAQPALERVSAIDAALAEGARRRAEINRGLMTKTEIADRLVEQMRTMRERFNAPPTPGQILAPDNGRDLVHRLSGNKNQDYRAVEPRKPEDALALLVWMLGADLETAARKAVSGIQYEEGLPAAERAAKLAELDQQEAALVEERERLVDRIADLTNGQLTLTHLPATQERRESERLRGLKLAKAREEQAALAARINARPRPERQASRSRYATGRGVVHGPEAYSAARSGITPRSA